MHLRCLQQGFVVTQNAVRALQQLDPEGVAARRKRRLVRRMYRSACPNAAWHMDGYDKLKPFGIAINGCIYGYSRKIMRLEAYTTNHNSKVILGYHLKAVWKQGGCPAKIRADIGTENRLIEHVQTLLCRSEKSFYMIKALETKE